MQVVLALVAGAIAGALFSWSFPKKFFLRNFLGTISLLLIFLGGGLTALVHPHDEDMYSAPVVLREYFGFAVALLASIAVVLISEKFGRKVTDSSQTREDQP